MSDQVVDPTLPVEPSEVPEESPVQLSTELQALIENPGTVVFDDGVTVKLHRLKIRQFLKMMKIVMHGAGAMIPALINDTDEDTFLGELSGLLLFSMPEAPDETLEFIESMIAYTPVPGPFDRRGLPTTTAGLEQADANDKLRMRINDMDLPDFAAIIEAIVVQESGDLASLGKRLRRLMELGQKTGQLRGK